MLQIFRQVSVKTRATTEHRKKSAPGSPMSGDFSVAYQRHDIVALKVLSRAEIG